MRAARLALHRAALRRAGGDARPAHGDRARACSTGRATDDARRAGAAALRRPPLRWRAAGRAPGWRRSIRPRRLPDEAGARRRHGADPGRAGGFLDPWLDGAPQTNEVGRSALLMSGLLVLADRFGLPLRLFELGASAGLNLQLDRYGYDLGGARGRRGRLAGSARARMEGPAAARGEGTDRRPGRRRPQSRSIRRRTRAAARLYLARPAASALAQARGGARHRRRPIRRRSTKATPPTGSRRKLARRARSRASPRVVMHSVAFHYFPADVQQRIKARLEAAGCAGHRGGAARLAAVREAGGGRRISACRLRTWPGDEQLLAWSHPHGSWVESAG